ncbi:FMR1 neighbor protein [Phacochoerus africanus]|uniref:FMR1 neighbor protein n=1 Tax=Phacochoerus africanus TaxID=41426 RepID=UPI001FD8AFB4|nr:FMR1 neighbor protein [Phacochoerus africanus]
MAAATPQPSWQASLRGLQAETRHSLLRMWAYKRFGLLLLGLWGLLLLYYYLSPGFVNSASPSENTLWTNENANGQSLEKNSASRALLSFLFPTTCILKENQVVKPCNPLQDFNKTECLRNKCCYSSLKTSNFNCFVPLKDKPTQMFRMFGFGVISMLILGWLPIYCFSLCQRSRWANPLRRKMNRILKGLKKRRNKLKRDAEMLGTAMDEEGLGDEKEQETKDYLMKALMPGTSIIMAPSSLPPTYLEKFPTVVENAQSTLCPVATTRNISRHCPLVGGANLYPEENHLTSVILQSFGRCYYSSHFPDGKAEALRGSDSPRSPGSRVAESPVPSSLLVPPSP